MSELTSTPPSGGGKPPYRSGRPGRTGIPLEQQRKYQSPRFHALGKVRNEEEIAQHRRWRSIDKLEDDLAQLSEDFQEGRMLAFGDETAAILSRLDEIRTLQERLAISHSKLTEQIENDLLEQTEVRSSRRTMEVLASSRTN